MMNQEDIFKKIGQILNELSDQYQYLAQNPEELNELELELFLANASFLTDHVQIIKKINNQAIQKVLPAHSGVKEEVNAAQPAASAYKVIDEPEYTHQEIPQVYTQPEVHPVKEEEPVQQPAIPAFEASGEQGYSPSAVSAEESQEEKKEAEAAPVKAAEPAQTFNWEQEHEGVHATPRLEDDIFKPDIEPATFEFILNEKPTSDRFEFEEKSVDEIFDRPLSKEEELIIAQKQKLREMDSLELPSGEEDEIGPEPFLVAEPAYKESVHASVTSVFEAPEPEVTEIKDTEPALAGAGTFKAELPREETPIAAAEPVKAHEPEEKSAPVSFAAPVSKPLAQEELFRPVVSVAAAQKEEQPAAQSLPRPTLNDILSGNTANRNVNAESRRAPITDLKQAISLNDKMRYIKDLFNGYNLAYAEAIDLLNKMPDFKTADTFLKNNYSVKHNWADKQETADQFYELLNMRFPLK